MNKRSIMIVLSILIAKLAIGQTDIVDYFGLKLPDTTAQDFNPSILGLEGSFVFNAIYNTPKCDEFYFTKIDSKENIYFSKKVDGKWQAPAIAPFSNTTYHDADPFFALSGKRVYFVSSRPTDTTDTKFDYNIWYADKINSGWDEPKYIPEPINSDYEEYFFCISDKGNAFFASNRPGGIGSFDIYKLKIMEDGTMSNPTNIGAPINTKKYEFDPYISPDESFILYSINNEQGFSDIFFSYKDDIGEWMTPVELGDIINTAREDFAPSISPDNKYFFFTSGGKLKWININFLNSYKNNN